MRTFPHSFHVKFKKKKKKNKTHKKSGPLGFSKVYPNYNDSLASQKLSPFAQKTITEHISSVSDSSLPHWCWFDLRQQFSIALFLFLETFSEFFTQSFGTIFVFSSLDLFFFWVSVFFCFYFLREILMGSPLWGSAKGPYWMPSWAPTTLHLHKFQANSQINHMGLLGSDDFEG